MIFQAIIFLEGHMLLVFPVIPSHIVDLSFRILNVMTDSYF